MCLSNDESKFLRQVARGLRKMVDERGELLSSSLPEADYNQLVDTMHLLNLAAGYIDSALLR